ncbi:MAG TPA: hypothetical protein VFY13_09405 [Luteolibacter sp.]|nr:hypothetical protein [Luteolibacter sp.]
MFALLQRASLASTFGLLAVAGVCRGQGDVAQLTREIEQLKQQNQQLQQSLLEANRSARESSEQLDQVRARLAALGRNLLDGGDDRLVRAASDLQIANERIRKIEDSSTRLMAAINGYLREAVVSDPAARVQVETSLRELDAVLGLRQKPRPDIRTGSLQQARIVSLDQESGMLVLNVGQSQGARIGMSFRLVRGQEPYGKAILTDLREGVCGVFVESIDQGATISPRTGDLAILETQAAK